MKKWLKITRIKRLMKRRIRTLSYRTFSQVMYRVENVYRLLPPDFFKGNYETYVVNTNNGHMLAFNRKRKEYDVVEQTTELFFYRNNGMLTHYCHSNDLFDDKPTMHWVKRDDQFIDEEYDFICQIEDALLCQSTEEGWL